MGKVHDGLEDLTKRHPWVGRLRMKSAAVVVGVPAVVAILVMVLSLPGIVVWPLVGATVAAVGVGVRQITLPLREHRCYTCGTSLAGEPEFEFGVVCPKCGSVNSHGADHDRLA